ncbi:hypothetical protein UMZ34_23275 [Halopseudomonas pachastrellae]|nr:hypothetical protein UMZ34_23275 [Halopseudomonas pachastrellae]
MSAQVSCRQHRFEAALAAQKQPRALLANQKYRTLALLVEYLGMYLLAACGNAPVDVADIVTGQVGTHLIKVHAAAAQARVLLTGLPAVAHRAAEQRQFMAVSAVASRLSSVLWMAGSTAALMALRPPAPSRSAGLIA